MPLTSSGLTAPTLLEIKAAIESQLREEVSSTLDLTASSPMGQTVAIYARETRLIWETLLALYSAVDPNGASGAMLDNLCALSGVVRKPPTYSFVEVEVDLDAGTYAAGDLVAQVIGNEENRFTNLEGITAPGGPVTIDLRATVAGPVDAPALSLEIGVPLTGWNTVSNADPAVEGEPLESDAQLRARRNTVVASPGSTTADAVAADLSAVDGVLSVNVLENDTDTTDADGVPPHSIEAIVYGPSAFASDIAQAIYDTKAAGIGTNGAEYEPITTAQGGTLQINWTTPTDVPALASFVLQMDPTTYPGDAEFRAQLAALAVTSLAVGDDLDWSDLVSWAMSIDGVLRISTVSASVSPAGVVAFANVPATIRELITLASGDIVVSSSSGIA